MKPYVGLVGTILIVVAVIAGVIYAASTGKIGANLPTTDLISDHKTSSSAATATLSVASDGCFFVEFDTQRAFAIWPKGFVQDGQVVVAPDGTRLADGNTFDATLSVTNRDELGFTSDNSLSEGPLSIASHFCLTDTDDPQEFPIAVLRAVG